MASCRQQKISWITPPADRFSKRPSTPPVTSGRWGCPPKAMPGVIGANDRVRVGVLGYADRFKDALLPSFRKHMKELNFEIVALADLWTLRREEGRGGADEGDGESRHGFAEPGRVAREGRGDRRGVCRHRRFSARAASGRGGEGGEGCLLRKSRSPRRWPTIVPCSTR